MRISFTDFLFACFGIGIMVSVAGVLIAMWVVDEITVVERIVPIRLLEILLCLSVSVWGLRKLFQLCSNKATF